jgi:hypothetical protein
MRTHAPDPSTPVPPLSDPKGLPGADIDGWKDEKTKSLIMSRLSMETTDVPGTCDAPETEREVTRTGGRKGMLSR